MQARYAYFIDNSPNMLSFYLITNVYSIVAAKNGVYVDLVGNVREAFEACELVRIDCQGLNPSDYRKIGAKLKVY